MKKGWKNRYLQEDQLTLVAPDLAAHLADRSSPHRSAIMELFRALAICHGVIADKPFEDKPRHIDYKAESPDGLFSFLVPLFASRAPSTLTYFSSHL